MNFPSPEIREEISTPKAIDFSLRFMPEELTALYHTPAYRSVTESQRLRYNQLHGLYFNEQTMFFEKALARNVLGYFLGKPLPKELKSGLRQFMAEEEQHTAMFRRLNQQCAPQLYAREDFHFLKVPSAAAKIVGFMSRRPNLFPLLLWLMHLQEERATFFGRTFLRFADSLEPHFLAAQRRHLADEIGHVGWDEALLDWAWPRVGHRLRAFNIRMFGWVMEEYFSAPKRSAIRVVAEWVQEFPELAHRYPEFCRQLRQLGGDANYRQSLYCRENVPNTFRRFDLWPEFRLLNGIMPGYLPGTNG